MKKFLFVLALFFASTLATAQAATRPVVLNWTSSTSLSVTGYSIYHCTVTSGTSCVPSTTGTPLTTVTTGPAVVNETVGFVYTYAVVANAPACTPTTPPSSACGQSTPALITTSVPLQTIGATGAGVAVP